MSASYISAWTVTFVLEMPISKAKANIRFEKMTSTISTSEGGGDFHFETSELSLESDHLLRPLTCPQKNRYQVQQIRKIKIIEVFCGRKKRVKLTKWNFRSN